MGFAPGVVQQDNDLERRPADPDRAKEAGSPIPVCHPGYLSALSSNPWNGSDSRFFTNPLMRHSTGGEMRVLALRHAQQGVGNHKTQQFVSQLQRSSVVQRECACGGTCEACQEDKIEEETESETVQRQTTAGAAGGMIHADVIPTNSPGYPLDHATRGFMESRFDTDLSDVRVHTDRRAAESADALAANAYTTGRDIYFAEGKYAPQSHESQHLLAHELTHTVQQGDSSLAVKPSGVLRLSQNDDPAEQEADLIADQIFCETASVTLHGAPSVARQADAGAPTRSGLEERATRPASKEVIRALEKPDPIAGVGDYREAFRVLNGLAMFDMLSTLDELKALGEFELLETHFGSAEGVNTERLRVALHAVRNRGSVTADSFAAQEGDAFSTLPPEQQGDIQTYLNSKPTGPVATQAGPVTPGSQTAPPVCSTPYKKAANFQELINLVRAAEGKLAASGISSVKDQIHALRGIYYGTVWSKDFAEEKSPTRNEGFQRFTRPSEDPAKTVPTDVRSALDCGLFQSLQDSQDMVDPSGRHFDFGHLIIGLDARFDPKLSTNVSYPVMGINIDMGGTGPELVTWVGDLGGGTARLARARVKAPGTSASISFVGSDYGGSINLEGDVAAYAVASGSSTALSAPSIPAGKSVSDALQDYLSPSAPGAAWKDRAKLFLAMNGGTFDPSGALTNRVALIGAFSAKFQVFACNYLASRVKDNHLTSATAKAAASHVIPASEEVAETFVNALEDSLKTGGKIEARRFPAAKAASPGACTQQILAAGAASLFSPGASVDEEEKETTPVQRQAAVMQNPPEARVKAFSAGDGAALVAPDVIPADSPGQPLDLGTRAFMEPHFRADFSDVRVHTDRPAAVSADALAANAYTTGRDIYFAAGKYAPSSHEGQHLLAHEITHVVQQGVGKQPSDPLALRDVKVGAADDTLETDAERAAEVITSGGPVDLKEEERWNARQPLGGVQRFIQRQGQPASGTASYMSQAFPQHASPSTTREESLTCQMEAAPVCVAGGQLPPVQRRDPGPRTVTVGGYVLSPRPDYLRSVLSQIGMAQGLTGMDLFLAGVESAQFGIPEASSGIGEGAEAAYTPDQLQLLAEIAPVMRSVLDRLKADYEAFGTLVRNAAVVRLTRNHHNLGLWREYVLSLAPQQVMGMAVAQEENPVLMAFLHSHAQGPFNVMDVYEQRSWATSRFQRDYLERLGTGKIHGGCEQCHEEKLARDLEYHSPTMGEAAMPLAVRMPTYSELNVLTPSPGKEIAGPLEQKQALPDWASSAIGNRPGSQAIATSLSQIRDYLKPLGDSGYRIISDEMVKDAMDGPQLVRSVATAIDGRRQGYLDLIAEIEKPGYNFMEPLQILQELLPFADPDVQAVVEGELKRRQEEKEAEAKAGFILGIAAMLLTIFPPTAPLGLALGAGLAAWGFASGYEDWQQGRRFEMGWGAGVFTRQQEDAARAMQAMGMMTMTLSAFALLDAGVASARLLRVPATGIAATGAADEVVGAEATSGDLRIRIEGLDGPSPTVRITQPDGTVQQFTVEELESMASKAKPGSAAQDVTEPGWGLAEEQEASTAAGETSVSSLESIGAAEQAGIPGELYGDGTVLTKHDLPGLLPEKPVSIGRAAPEPLPTGGRAVGGSAVQNTEVQADILLAEKAGAKNIRVNQTQVIEDLRGGTNRPDLSFELNGRRIHIEYDRFPMERAMQHARRILSNDPDAIVILKGLDFD